MNETELRQLIERRYGSVRQFAISIDMPPSTINSMLTRGMLNSNVENVLKVCTALGIKPEIFKSLLGADTDNTPEIITIYNQLEEDNQAKVLDFAKTRLSDQTKKQGVVSRVFEQRRKEQQLEELQEIDELFEVEGTTYAAAAQGFGRGFDADDYDTYTVYTDEEPPYHDYAIGVRGDSMLPKYEDGDMLYLVDRGLSYYSGQLCVIVIDGQTYFKKVYTEDNGLRLVSLNRKYDDIFIDLPPEEDTYIRIYDVVGSFTPIDN